jgi:hypothetical protein
LQEQQQQQPSASAAFDLDPVTIAERTLLLMPFSIFALQYPPSVDG